MDNLAILAKQFENLERAKFPDFTGIDPLDDWIGDLALTDSQLAGLASCAKSGTKINKNDLPSLEDLERRLERLSNNNDQIVPYLENCKGYLKLLLDLSDTIKSM